MRKWLALSILAFGIVGCGGNGDNSTNLPTRRNVTPGEVEKASKDLTKGKSARVAEESNNFGFKLLAELQKLNPNQNALVSPLGISMALSMAYNGASGTTKTAMEKALGFDGLLLSDVNDAEKQFQTVFAAPDPKVQIEIANSLWARTGLELKRDYLARMQDNFGAPPNMLDFKSEDAPKQINAWVAQATRDKIKDMVKTIPDDTALFLINAVYFKGLWSNPFDPKLTADKDFTNFEGKKSAVSMMSRRAEIEYFQNDKARMVRLPYGSGRLAMVFVLPPENGNLKALQKDVNWKTWQSWSTGLKPMMGTVMIPKFRAEFESKMNDALGELGMSVAFTDKADFSGMKEPNDLYIKEVLHKTFIDVNEEGAEAAAATKVEVGITSAPAQPVKEFMFMADRPFLYAITDKTTGVILFLGVYGDPK